MAADYEVIVAMQRRELGGVETFCDNLVDGLCRAGVRATRLLTEAGPEAGPPRTEGKQVPTEQLRVSRWATWGQRWRALRNLLESRAPCIYIPNDDEHHSCICPTLSEQVRIIGVIHSDSTWHYDYVARLGAWWDAVVAVSPSIARQATVVDPSLGPRLSVIPYGVSVPPTVSRPSRPPNAPLRVIYAGRTIQQQKRVYDLPAVVMEAASRGVPLELTIAGDGNSLDDLRNHCASLAGSGSIRFTGAVSNGKVLELFAANDVVILTSAYEGLPLMLLEAMGQGCVPVVTDTRSGIPDVIKDAVNGYRVPVGGIWAFAERLEGLYHNPKLVAQMGHAARETVVAGGYRTEDMVERYQALSEHLVDPRTNGYVRRRGPVRPPIPLKYQRWVPHPVWLGERFLFKQFGRLNPGAGRRWSADRARPGLEWQRR